MELFFPDRKDFSVMFPNCTDIEGKTNLDVYKQIALHGLNCKDVLDYISNTGLEYDDCTISFTNFCFVTQLQEGE